MRRKRSSLALMGIVLVLLVTPWGYVYAFLISARGEPWHADRTVRGAKV